MIEIDIFPIDIIEEDITEFIIDFGLCYYQRNYYNIDINNNYKN
jgi:hypothetical protein